jgi:hypothetical protein
VLLWAQSALFSGGYIKPCGQFRVGVLGAGMMIWYVWRCTRDHNGFENAFGAGWEDQIPSQQAKHMVKRRWSPILYMNASPELIWERDVPF